jgi:hypothetical protein
MAAVIAQVLTTGAGLTGYVVLDEIAEWCPRLSRTGSVTLSMSSEV